MRKRKELTQKGKDSRYVVGAAKLLFVINYLGRYCKNCNFDGYSEPWFMDLHHKDPKIKEYEVKNLIMHGSFARLKSEIDKCELLCGQCHRRLHANTNKLKKFEQRIKSKLEEVVRNNGLLHDQRLYSNEEESKIKKLINDGNTIKEIAAALRRPYDCVKAKIRWMGLKANRQVMKLDNEKMLTLFNEKCSLRKIGREMGISYMTVRKRLQKLGCISFNDNLHHNAVIQENKRRMKKE